MSFSKLKITALKEELLEVLYPLYMEQQAGNATSAYAFIQEAPQRILFLRLLSFIGRANEGTSMGRELSSVEKEEGKCYSFADNLPTFLNEQTVDVRNCYLELVSEIKKVVLSPSDLKGLIGLRDSFDRFLAKV